MDSHISIGGHFENEWREILVSPWKKRTYDDGIHLALDVENQIYAQAYASYNI